MTKRRAPRGTLAVQALERAGVPFTLHPYEPDPGDEGYGLAAARALGVDPGRVFKTLIASLTPAPGERAATLVVAMVPVDRQLDLKALARAAGAKSASLADPDLAERSTGYILGGISPFGQRQSLRAFIDDGALEAHLKTPIAGVAETVYVSAGRRGLQLEIGHQRLIDLTRAEAAPIAR
ncbi:MAG TPA: aminoacyl-tRNA deacylase [Dehalococcoidia bacterium]|nr:aminoacyl-tRNA deacylase [Dehalococcoidia bacterium]